MDRSTADNVHKDAASERIVEDPLNPAAAAWCDVGSRLHIGLLNVSSEGPRQYGGAGIALANPKTTVQVRPRTGPGPDVVAFDSALTFDPAHIEAAVGVCRRSRLALGISQPVAALVEECPPSHIGLGSKTALASALAFSIAKRFGKRITSSSQLGAITLRGGVSSIGTHAAFTGGFLVDGGHPQDGSLPLGPSRSIRNGRVAPLILTCSVPSNWQFILLSPPQRDWSGHGDKEAELFEKYAAAPHARSQNRAATELVYHGIVPALISGSIGDFSDSLRAFNAIGFKRAEIGRYGPDYDAAVSLISDAVGRRGACGMSSMGPLLYIACVDQDVLAIRSIVDPLISGLGLAVFATTHARPAGCKVGWHAGS